MRVDARQLEGSSEYDQNSRMLVESRDIAWFYCVPKVVNGSSRSSVGGAHHLLLDKIVWKAPCKVVALP